MVESIKIKPSKNVQKTANLIYSTLFAKEEFVNPGKIHYYLSDLKDSNPVLNEADNMELLQIFKQVFQRKPKLFNLRMIMALVTSINNNYYYNNLCFTILKMLPSVDDYEERFFSDTEVKEEFHGEYAELRAFKLLPFLTSNQAECFLKKLGKYTTLTLGELFILILDIWDSNIYEYKMESHLLYHLCSKRYSLSDMEETDILYDKDKLTSYLVKKLSDDCPIKDVINEVKDKKSDTYIFLQTMATYVELILTDDDYKKEFTIKLHTENKMNLYISEVFTSYKDQLTMEASSYCLSIALLYKGSYKDKSLKEKIEFFKNSIKSFYSNIGLFAFTFNSSKSDYFYNKLPEEMQIFHAIARHLVQIDCPIEKVEGEKIYNALSDYFGNGTKPREITPKVAVEASIYMPDNELPQYNSFEEVMEAYNKANTEASKVVNKGYSAYRKFLNNVKPIDSQLDKLSKVMKDMVLGNQRKKIIEGKEYTPWTLVKKLLGGFMVFQVSKVVFFLGLLVRYTLGKDCSRRERRKIVSELSTEIEILEEKIEDAKMAGDNKAKYEMMRTRAELKKTLTQIKSGLDVADDKAKKKTSVVLGTGISVNREG